MIICMDSVVELTVLKIYSICSQNSPLGDTKGNSSRFRTINCVKKKVIYRQRLKKQYMVLPIFPFKSFAQFPILKAQP